MEIELVRPAPDDADALGEICYRAFAELFKRHGIPLDFPDSKAGQGLVRMLLSRPDFYAAAAKIDGEFAGSNFLQLSDTVAAVGPITVSPKTQAHGVGRALMTEVIGYALKHHGSQVRLVQDAVNVASISLYTSLGFAVVEPLSMVTVPAAQAPDGSVRLAKMSDLDRLDELCRRVYRVSRRNELAGSIAHGAEHGMPVFLREGEGGIRAYAIPSLVGHGVAVTNDDLLITIRHANLGRGEPPSSRSVLCPSRNAELYRAILQAGGKTLRCLHLMAMGPYEPPAGAWYPSISY